jgi:hypothetical protein
MISTARTLRSTLLTIPYVRRNKGSDTIVYLLTAQKRSKSPEQPACRLASAPAGPFRLDSRAGIRFLRTTSPMANCGRASSLRYSGRPPPGRTDREPSAHDVAGAPAFAVVARKHDGHRWKLPSNVVAVENFPGAYGLDRRIIQHPAFLSPRPSRPSPHLSLAVGAACQENLRVLLRQTS